MTAGVSATVSAELRATLRGAADFGRPKAPVSLSHVLTLLEGTATVLQADIMYADERVLTASESFDLDLSGAITDAFGATIAMAEVVAIYLENDIGSIEHVRFFGSSSNAFQGPLSAGAKLELKPGGAQLFTGKQGWTVTAGSGDKLAVANQGVGAATYRIGIVGRSVAA